MSWEITLFLAAAIQGVILSVLFISDRKNIRKVFLGIYLLAFSLTIFNYLNFWTQAYALPSPIQGMLVISSWVMPFTFYYFINKKEPLSKLKYHLIPPIVFGIYWFSMQFILAPLSYYQNAAHVIFISQTSLFLVYAIAALRIINKDKSNWLFFVAFASFIVGLLSYKITIMTNTYTLRVDYIVCAGFVILTYGITYLSEFSFLKERVKPKYSSSSLTKEDGDYLVQKINAVLEQNKYYKDPDFNLSSFAERLGVPKYRISQALNAFSEKSFSELINEFRVEEAKERLQDEASIHLKLEAIGEEVGFRNKVSFYKNFKKLVGSSPGEFREDHIQKSA